jgi:endothelin-converting enzyme/putative endopeptidase
VDDIRVNGQLTLGENVADLGGLKLSHAATMAWAQKHPEEEGKYRFTPSQQFFLGFAQSWCAKVRPEFARVAAQVDPHSPAFLRVNGPLRNLDTFRQAFNCPAGAKMVRPAGEACQVW